ncbi:MAG: hypothetical protein GC162_04065 [Planctomycetes bacterium]|nr:hypothetical protein [Planctomycetota bacterium]
MLRVRNALLIVPLLIAAATAQIKSGPIHDPLTPEPPSKQIKSGLADPLTPPNLDDASPGDAPAGANATGDATDPNLFVVSNSQEAALLARMRKAMLMPGPAADEAAVKKQLNDLADDASQLAMITQTGPLHMHALSMQMQALYAIVQRWPADPAVDRSLSRLRSAARRTKALDQPEAAAVGDFWLLTADLFDINRSGLTLDERRRQTQQLFDGFLEEHGTGATSDAVRAMLAQLNPPQAPAPPVSGSREAAPTPAPTTPPPTPTPTPAPVTPPVTGANQTADLGPMPPKPVAAPEAAGPIITPAFELGDKKQEGHVTTVILRSRFQPGENTLRILTPDKPFDAAKPMRVLFVLPVEAGRGEQFGDGFTTVQRLDLQSKYNLLVVAPTFTALPWYANHPSSADLQQESYMVKAIVPAVDELYPQAKQRLLLGFSKSGWGAMSLAIRFPDLFDAAAAWDAPLMKEAPDNYGMGPIFGTQQNFDLYALPRAFRDKARILHRRERLALLGYDHFRDDMQRAHTLLDQLQIPHEFADGPERRHHWDSGWVEQAVEMLIKIADQPPM